jgi:hypothetical protein
MLSPAQHNYQTVSTHGLLTALPQEYILKTSSCFKDLQVATKAIFDSLNANGEEGNQFIVVISLTKSALERLDNDKSCLGGISYRFMWMKPLGL